MSAPHPDGQPNSCFSLHRRQSRDSSEVLGTGRDIWGDDELADSEIEFLANWLWTNEELAAQWPFDRLVGRFAAVLEDERIDDDERAELHGIVREILGQPSPGDFVNAPTTFPLTKPEPEIFFDSKEFVLIGRFASGTRKLCEGQIRLRGGSCCEQVTLRTNYLVIGAMSSRDWLNTSWGRTIELAARYAESHPLYVVTEKRWVDYLLG